MGDEMSRKFAVALTAALTATAVMTAPAQAAVTVTELGKAPDFTSYAAFAINDDGVAVGYAQGEFEGRSWAQAIKWNRAGEFELVGEWIVNYGESANAINNRGQIAGMSRQSDGRDLPVRFEPDGRRALLDPGPGYDHANVKGIDDTGAVYGEAWNGSTQERTLLRWNSNGVRAVLPLPEGFLGSGYLVSASPSGYAVGWAFHGDQRMYPVRWSPDGSVTALPLLPGGAGATGSSVNRHGEVVGGGRDADNNYHSLKWNRDGSVTVLGQGGHARAINDEGVAVGLDGEFKPVRWSGTGEVLALGKPNGADQSAEAWAINNAGEIVGFLGSRWERQTGLKWTVSAG